MKKITLLIILFISTLGFSQDLPLDFETSPVTADFVGFDGGTITVEAVAAPQATGNTSANLAKLVRDGGQAWAGAGIELDSNLDFTTKKFITARVWTDAPVGTKIMFKTEQDSDAGNNSGEKDTFTTVTGDWETIVLDFSGVTNANQNKLVLIPDNGNLGDGSAASTFYFDDIVQTETNPTTATYDLPFDFETSPVTADFVGFDGGTITVEAVAAPQSTGNTSANLAKLVRDGGQAWAGAATVLDSNLDFTTKKFITARVWTDAPVGTKIMFKTEQDSDGGNNSGEKDTFTTVTGDWETIVLDFSGVTNANQNKLVLIPDNGNLGDGSAASTFYFDDIAQSETDPNITVDLPLDFETSPVTADFVGFDGGTITVEAVAAPQSTGNTSANLAKLVRDGGQAWAGAGIELDSNLDFTTKKFITARVWTDAPVGTKIMFKTEQDSDAGNNSGEKDTFTTVTGDWETIVLDFSGVTNANQNKLVLIPDNGNLGDGSAASTFYFDDIVQTETNPTTATYDLPFDFETSPVTADFVGFDGGTLTVEAVAAPQSTGNTSANLAKLVRDGGQAWAGAATVLDSNLDFTTKKFITARVWTDAPVGTKIMFKTEQDSDGGNNSGEKDTFTTVTGDWETIVLDFSGVTNANQNKLVLIPDNGNLGDGSAASTFYFDDIIQTDTNPNITIDLPLDFETSPVTADFVGFDGGTITVEAVAAPQSTGNTSANLAKLVRDGGQAWAGAGIELDSNLDFTTKKFITARVWTDAPVGTKIMFKTEQDSDAGNNSGEKDTFTTVTGDWETIVLDFSGVTNANQNKLVLIPDNGNLGDGTSASTFYFDDIIQTATAGVEDNSIVNVSVYPNPSNSNWNFRTGNTVITSVEVFNLLGKRVVSQNNNSTEIAISTQGLSSGIYIARITTEQGVKSVKLIRE